MTEKIVKNTKYNEAHLIFLKATLFILSHGMIKTCFQCRSDECLFVHLSYTKTDGSVCIDFIQQL